MIMKALLLALMATTVISARVDQTLTEKAKGEDVVNAVVYKIQSSKIFNEDYDFLKRIAYVESKFGENANTYPAGNYTGGIWQLDEIRYDASKNVSASPSLKDKHSKITGQFNIDWANSTKWNDLLKPFYSGLAARLLISTIEEEKKAPIPQTLAAQAKYWNTYYNRRDNMYESNFTDAVTEMDNKTSSCKGKMDLLVLLDGSGSVGNTSFQKSLTFVNDLFGSYSSENVRKGFIQFASNNQIRFALNNNLTDKEIQETVAGTEYLAGGTNTNGGILASVDMYKKTVARPGVPKVLTVFTDGGSNEGGSNGNGGVPDIIQVQKENITSYAIGIGSSINQRELQLIALNETSHVFELTDFAALTEFFKRLNTETCSIPQTPEFNESTKDVLTQGERRYYDFTIPAEGLTVIIDTAGGKTEGYFSYTMKTPSAALNDGVLNDKKTFIPRPASPAGTKVVVAVKGLETKNDYTLEIQKGNVAGASSLILPLNFLLAALSAFLIMK